MRYGDSSKPPAYSRLGMDSASPETDELAEFVRAVLPDIDSFLAQQQVDVSARTLDASRTFVEYFVEDVEGDTKDKYWERPWFSIIFWHVRKWYQERYGDQLLKPRRALPGLVFINHTPFKLSIPMTESEAEEPGKSWLRFPVKPDQSLPLEAWFESPPNLSSFSSQEYGSIKGAVHEVICLTRSFNLALMTGKIDEEGRDNFRKGIMTHLEAAVLNSIGNSQAAWATARWELHLLVEMTIKLFLKQKADSFPFTHDLDVLRAKADPFTSTKGLEQDFSVMLSEKEAIASRYTDIGHVASEELFQHYISSLRVAVFFARNLPREMNIEGLAILLKRPPWLELPNC